MAFTGRMGELMKKYGKVGIGVHFSVSAVSITSLYVAIKNNIDVESVFEKFGLSPGVAEEDPSAHPSSSAGGGGDVVTLDGHESPETLQSMEEQQKQTTRNRTAEMAASSGGALALAILCNKALFPVRVPLTVALTPPIARFLARRNILRNH
ncbi:hypothetical protein Cni_G27394 [Canna indica]|uniref:DUF1279 domain-containing protein n=1 Tax=Canna indica TaxID=4628 RepID=A0AAQ3L0Q9_9LILI|nr:hypothetical protein Cni_G27394 [Canna indica]